MSTSRSVNVVAAPGPVVYPLLAGKDDRIKVNFGKEGNADAVFDSTVSLIRRGLRIDRVLVKGLMQVVPKPGEKVAVWRKGSAADVLIRAYARKTGKKMEIVYTDDQSEVTKLLKSGNVDSAVVSSAAGKGTPFEELLPELPGSCAVHLNANEDIILEVYMKGIEEFRNNPDQAVKRVAAQLPMKVDESFIKGAMTNSLLVIEKPKDFSSFKELLAPILAE